MNTNALVIFETKDGVLRLDVSIQQNAVWLSANQMAVLFDKDEKTIRKHINNVFSEAEVERENNTQKMRVDEKSCSHFTAYTAFLAVYRGKSAMRVYSSIQPLSP